MRTKQLLQEYISLVSGTREKAYLLDRPEVYEYEKQHRVQLVDMTAAQIQEMVETFVVNQNNKAQISPKTRRQYLVEFQRFFRWYAQTYMAGGDSIILDIPKVVESRPRKDVWAVEGELIKNILSSRYTPEDAIYYECLIRFFYEGVPDAESLVLLKPQDIDLNQQQMYIEKTDTTYEMSDRLCYLYLAVNQMDGIQSNARNVTPMLRWHGSAMKFKIAGRVADEVDSRSLESMGRNIRTSVRLCVQNNSTYQFQIKDLYNAGFIVKAVQKLGRDQYLHYANKRRRGNGFLDQYDPLYDYATKEYGIRDLLHKFRERIAQYDV